MFLKFCYFLPVLLLWSSTIFGYTAATSTGYPTIKKSELKKFDFSPGIHDHVFTLNNGEAWPVKISIPQLEPGETAALIVSLHWAGGPKTYQEYFDCLVQPATDSLNAIVITPSSDNGGRWFEEATEERVIHLVRNVQKYWPVTENQTIITGYSNGAIGAWKYATKYPKLFRAAVPVSGSYNVIKVNIPVYLIHGAKDELFPVGPVMDAVDESVQLGSSIQHEIILGLNHYQGCDYVDPLNRMFIKALK